MNISKLIFVSIFLAFTFACSNEFEIADEWKNIPVVYALIDVNEEFNYFRIEKAFIDPETSAITIAGIADSLYYGPEIVARVTNLRNNNIVDLERINLEEEGFGRMDPIFADSPNIGYKLRVSDLNIERNDELQFDLIAANDEILTTAKTTVVGEHELVSGRPVNPIKIPYERDVSFGVRSTEQAAVFYDLRVIINYEESFQSDPTVRVPKRLVWLVEKGNPRTRSSSSGFSTQTIFKVEGIDFYRYLQNNIPQDATVSRFFTGIDLQYDGGGQELFDYINIGQANTGITSNQVIPSYTNFDNDAVGVFSSRITARNEDIFNLNTAARDSLRDGIFTRELNFQ